MATVAELLTIPRLAGAVEPLAPVALDRRVESVAVLEDLHALGTPPPDSLVIVAEAASREAVGYRLDVLLRQASSREVAALALVREPLPRPSRTAVELAQRGHLALLRLSPRLGLAEAVIAVQQELAGGVSRLLERARACLDLIDEAERLRLSPATLVERAAEALGAEVRLGPPPGERGWLSVPVLIDGEPGPRLSTPGEGGDADTVRRLLLHRLVAAIERLESARQRAAEVPVQTRAELLTELLVREPQASRDLVRRARQLGIPIDGWHVVVRLELENLAELRPGDEVGAFNLAQLAVRVATESARATGGTWNRAGTGSTLLLVRSWQAEVGPELQAEVARAADLVIGRLRARIPRLVVRCGVGGVHVGSTGLRTSAMEARAALTAALTTGRRNLAVRFDSTGLRRVLLQWYALDEARDSVARLLEPLDRLGERRGREAIRTLRAYLDAHLSAGRAAETLGLHRNTVAYRIQRILELLGVDPEDPEQCLMLQLACRAREL
ncbi:MAG TPA: helix-turn-helix domain-containing protein [Candidatus Dormibacteraeota bacterium]|jgi:sugar diacid utilization regulator|nr:helix-turn-helix domain-containing protein [Candidatus Dormibacteraeota bacterium]